LLKQKSLREQEEFLGKKQGLLDRISDQHLQKVIYESSSNTARDLVMTLIEGEGETGLLLAL